MNKTNKEYEKYRFTGETKVVKGATLHRIVAIRSFSNVKEGDIGGWIEKEENLSHDGDCWVFDEACVFDNAEVLEDALVYRNAKVYGNAYVSDNAEVCGNAKVYGNAEVYDYEVVCGDTEVHGNTDMFNKV